MRFPASHPSSCQSVRTFEAISPVSIKVSYVRDADIEEMVKDGTRVDHFLSAFATKMYQIDNALKVSLDPNDSKHWSHALPAVMKDDDVEIGEEGRAIEVSFIR